MVDTSPASDEVTTKYEGELPDRSSNSTPKPKESNANKTTPVEEIKPRVTNAPVRILVVGPSGSGKTCTIKRSFYGPDELKDNTLETTKHAEVTSLDYKGRTLEVIDTPGFDNISMSDVEAFTEIADYLLNPERVQMGVSGIIYVHRAGNAVHSRSLLRNFRVLTNIFLGKPGIARLTFLVTQSDTPQVDWRRSLTARGSAFNAAFSAGAKVAHDPNEAGLIQLLEFHASQAPIILPVQTDVSYQSHPIFVTRVERELGYYEYNSARSLLDDQERQLRESYDRRLANHRESEAQLHQQLQLSQLEYSSLRSQLQLQENIEQSQVVQTLKDINRMIDDIGRSVSAYLTDNFVQPIFDRDAARVTSLHSRDLPALMALLSHQEGRSSFIASSTGQGMHIEGFLDYTIRHFLCRFLVYRIFRPFHPEIDVSLSKTLLASYEKIQNREPQAIAGKWRLETFKSLHKADADGATEQEINSHLHILLNHRLAPLVKGVFGRDIPLEDIHIANLRSLIKLAWSWNSNLKGGVIMLGDFVQTYFPRSRFNANSMEEFEAVSPDHVPTVILGTLALGLVCRRAIGGGNPTEEVVVCKALVATRNIFN
ncbi:AIG1 domain protein [Rhizoctonia solani AG-3 Rhs1AP]|uniref:AIG1 domain protein n=1 Tax=Rhizoctonia solani AG-3 Rhs1AP TaxID=1086054 RepID=X8J523_9AGAM|nr:AIG1 domain protein [Rhizoctonia solani AG-3 Rhs1AP]